MVCKALRMITPSGRYLFSRSTTWRKKSTPSIVGSPPCQENQYFRRSLPSLGGYVVAHIGLEHRVRHSKPLGIRIEPLLFEVIAVGAIQIAARPDRLSHHLKRTADRPTRERIVGVTGGDLDGV